MSLKEKKENDEVNIGMVYEALINLQLNVAKLETEVKWIKQILYVIIGFLSAFLTAVFLK